MIDWVRLILSFEIGALLAVSGSLVQSSTNNDMASPSTLGLNAGVVLVILLANLFNLLTGFQIELEVSSLYLFLISWGAFLLYWWRRKSHNKVYGSREDDSPTSIILIGLCFNLFVGALFSVAHFISMARNVSFPAELWFGSMRFSYSYKLILMSLICVFVWSYIKRGGYPLSAMSFGSDFAQGLGFDVRKTRRNAILVSLFITGIITTQFGVFAFAGLIFPHLIRALGPKTMSVKTELTVGALGAGLIFALLDLFCAQVDFWGAEIPVGMLSSVLGSLFLFILLFLRFSAKR